jgi:hypothetical protein
MDGRPSDKVGVVTPFELPKDVGLPLSTVLTIQNAIAQGSYRKDSRTTTGIWVGKVFANVLNLKLSNVNDKRRIKARIEELLESGFLKVGTTKTDQRKIVETIEVGTLADPDNENL